MLPRRPGNAFYFRAPRIIDGLSVKGWGVVRSTREGAAGRPSGARRIVRPDTTARRPGAARASTHRTARRVTVGACRATRAASRADTPAPRGGAATFLARPPPRHARRHDVSSCHLAISRRRLYTPRRPPPRAELPPQRREAPPHPRAPPPPRIEAPPHPRARTTTRHRAATTAPRAATPPACARHHTARLSTPRRDRPAVAHVRAARVASPYSRGELVDICAGAPPWCDV